MKWVKTFENYSKRRMVKFTDTRRYGRYFH